MHHDFLKRAERWIAALPECAARETVAAARIVQLRASEPPWHGTRIHMQAGDAYSLFASGRIQWSARDPTLHAGPRYHLWARVAPGGRIFNPTCDTATFVADVDGELELGIYMGVWKNATGDLATSESLYRRLGGGIDVLAIGWRGDPETALASVDTDHSPPRFFRAELTRLRASPTPPAGWEYLLETGHAAIFADASGPTGERAIAVHSDDDQGIVVKQVDCALTATTRIAWRWCVTAHPSKVAENRPQTHDYISVATQFDNGRDLTWIWSSELAAGTHFHCPIGAWTARETHWVVRTGPREFGQWCAEDRNVYADVLAAMGTPPETDRPGVVDRRQQFSTWNGVRQVCGHHAARRVANHARALRRQSWAVRSTLVGTPS